MAAQLKAAKEALEQSFTALKYSKSTVSKAINQSTGVKINTRTLNTKLQNLEDALAQTNIAHTSWVSKAELTSEQLLSGRQ